MNPSQHPRMTVDQFVAWAMQQPEGASYELDAGVVVAMAPERIAHALTKFRITQRFAEAIAQAGLPCVAYPDGVGVRIDAETMYIPDAMVCCGAADPPDATEVANPIVVVEVRSRSTGGRDAGEKLGGYLRLPSLRHYLIVIAHTRTIIHHARGEDGAIATTIVRDGPVRLDPPGIVLDGVWPAAGPGSTPA